MRCPPQGAALPSGARAAFRPAFEAALPASPGRQAASCGTRQLREGGGREGRRRALGRSALTARGLCLGSDPRAELELPMVGPELPVPEGGTAQRGMVCPGSLLVPEFVVLFLPRADIALIGLAVMGQNLILNMNDHGFVVSERKRRAEGLAQ